jgi:hypothetical protein
VLLCADKLSGDFCAQDLAVARAVGDFAAIALRNARRFSTVERVGLCDRDTGAYNLAYFIDYAVNRAAYIDAFSGGAGTSGNNWDVENLTKTGITFCNATFGGTGTNGTGSISSPQDKAQTNTNPPLMRAVNGNYALWSAAERFQCYFQSEGTSRDEPDRAAARL